MSKFFVGQRVRLIGAGSFPELIGQEARVTGINVTGIRVPDLILERGMVDLDIPAPGFPGKHICSKPEYLEPILPEGAAPSEFTFQQLMDKLNRIEA